MAYRPGYSLSPLFDRPVYHLAPKRGWLNDPNGPLYFKGYYHLFFQHLQEGCIWNFGLVWGHAISKDLVHWELLPPALVPTPGGLDQDGCFSGCATIDTDGRPVILYTGVRLRNSETCGPNPPPECDLNLPFVESQCAAFPADLDDPKLEEWTKMEYPWLSLPPPNMQLGGWRDPFIVGRPGVDGEKCWSLVIGSGIKYEGGVILKYQSRDLLQGWELVGELCAGRGKIHETGCIWECPLLCKLRCKPVHGLQPAPSVPFLYTSPFGFSANGMALQPIPESRALPAGPGTPDTVVDDHFGHFFCISPDAATNPSYYWLGRYVDGRFDIDNAVGPFKLDLGDVVYAPNALEDEKNNRTLLWIWVQEKRTVGTYDYAGCMSLPRVMWLRPLPRSPEDIAPSSGDVSRSASDSSLEYKDKIEHSKSNPLIGGDSTETPHKPSSAEEDKWVGGPAAGTETAAQAAGSGSSFSSAAGSRKPRPKVYLHQEPIPELAALRVPGRNWNLTWGLASSGSSGVVLEEGNAIPVQGVFSPFLELTVELKRHVSHAEGEVAMVVPSSPRPAASGSFGASPKCPCQVPPEAGLPACILNPPTCANGSGYAAASSGLLFKTWQSAADGSAALLYHWDSGMLEVVFEAVDPATMTFSLSAPGARRVGGRLLRPPAAGESLQLHVFFDYSVLEVFTGGGEVLSTRVYRGAPPPGEGSGVELVSFGCSTVVLTAAANELQSAFAEDDQVSYADGHSSYTPQTFMTPAMLSRQTSLTRQTSSMSRQPSGVPMSPGAVGGGRMGSMDLGQRRTSMAGLTPSSRIPSSATRHFFDDEELVNLLTSQLELAPPTLAVPVQ